MGSPSYAFILDLIYVCLLLNHTYYYDINGMPITKSIVSTIKMILLLNFWFWRPFYYKVDDSDFPLNGTENRDRWVGIAEHYGHNITFKVLNNDNHKVLFCYNLWSAE